MSTVTVYIPVEIDRDDLERVAAEDLGPGDAVVIQHEDPFTAETILQRYEVGSVEGSRGGATVSLKTTGAGIGWPTVRGDLVAYRFRTIESNG